MMKKGIAALAACFTLVFANAQCTADYDFGDAGFGVSPFPENGEQFEEGVLNEPYEDVIHVLVPTNGGELTDLIPEEFQDFASLINLDSLVLGDVSIQIDGMWSPVSNLGLQATCYNNGDSSNPCTFLPGEQYCSTLTGTPNQAGVFPMSIQVFMYFVLGTEQVIEQVFDDDYFLTINETTGIAELSATELNVLPNSPNPVISSTTIRFTTDRAAETTFRVTNLIGEEIHAETVQAKRGSNAIQFDAGALSAGVYLYTLEAGAQKTTQRMIVR